MRRVYGWFSREIATFRGVAVFVFVALLVHLVYTFGVLWFADAADITFSGSGMPKTFPPYPSVDLIAGILSAAFAEEMLFRLIPFGILGLLVGRHRWLLLLAALGLSALFGFVHGGATHIMLQGGGGLIYSVVYLKCGGWNWGLPRAFRSDAAALPGSPFRGFLAACTIHALFNWSVFTLDYFLPNLFA
jgi:membrane protease YdiL (CAAX protease family)